MKSIDRLAMELIGKTNIAAANHLERFSFSKSEIAEIIYLLLGPDDRIAAPWGNIAKAIKSTMLCSVRIGSRKDMTIDGLPQAYPQAYSHHNDQAISGDDINRRQREKALGFRKETADWADCKKVIMCLWTGQVPRSPFNINNTYLHWTTEGR